MRIMYNENTTRFFSVRTTNVYIRIVQRAPSILRLQPLTRISRSKCSWRSVYYADISRLLPVWSTSSFDSLSFIAVNMRQLRWTAFELSSLSHIYNHRHHHRRFEHIWTLKTFHLYHSSHRPEYWFINEQFNQMSCTPGQHIHTWDIHIRFMNVW